MGGDTVTDKEGDERQRGEGSRGMVIRVGSRDSRGIKREREKGRVEHREGERERTERGGRQLI